MSITPVVTKDIRIHETNSKPPCRCRVCDRNSTPRVDKSTKGAEDEEFNRIIVSRGVLEVTYSLTADIYAVASGSDDAYKLQEISLATPDKYYLTWAHKHKESDKIDFVIKERLGGGSTGAAYRGTVTLTLHNGQSITRTMVIKVSHPNEMSAFNIQREYSIYECLRERGVKSGLVGVHGLYRHTSGVRYILLMDDGGKSLYQREYESRGRADQVTISRNEFDYLLSVVESINIAGIRHCDIKPSNIVCNEDGKLFIVDFSIADMEDVLKMQDINNLVDIYIKTFQYGKYGFN